MNSFIFQTKTNLATTGPGCHNIRPVQCQVYWPFGLFIFY